MRMKPNAHPFNASTYGRDSTPEPMAEAQSEKIDPLKEPFSSLPKALLKKGLLCPFGEKRILPGLTFISAFAFLYVVGDTTLSKILIVLPVNIYENIITCHIDVVIDLA